MSGINTIFTSNRQVFKNRHSRFVDRLLAYTAQDIETRIKVGGRTPVDTGGMKADVRSLKVRDAVYTVLSGKEYSSVQERGKWLDGSHVIKNYTTPGTGAGWFMEAVLHTQSNAPSLVNEVVRMMI